MAKKIESTQKVAASVKPAKKPVAKPLSSGAVESLSTPGAPAPAPLKAAAAGFVNGGKAAPAKPSAKKAAPSKAAKTSASRAPVSFSTEDISLRAYFIAEHRQRHGVHGDEHSDWVEAERQLRAEHRKKAGKSRAKK